MKKTSHLPLTRRWPALATLAFVALVAAPLHAFEGIEDTVIITADLTDGAKWSRESVEWNRVVAALNEEIARTNEIIDRMGDTGQVKSPFLRPVPGLMKPADDALALQTRQDALRTADGQYFLNSVAIKTYKDSNAVGASFEAFGSQVQRDPKRYSHFMLQEAMNARYKQAVVNAESAEKAEMDVQRDALDALQAAKTQSEIELFNGVIAASHERLDLAHAKAAQAKSELDVFRAQLGFEDQKKAEADHEWAQTVVERMRQKALDAYNAQFGKGADSSS